jgi:hypothetical protein
MELRTNLGLEERQFRSPDIYPSELTPEPIEKFLADISHLRTFGVG